MIRWRVYGYNRRGEYTWLCNLDAPDEAEARRLAGYYYGYRHLNKPLPLRVEMGWTL